MEGQAARVGKLSVPEATWRGRRLWKVKRPEECTINNCFHPVCATFLSNPLAAFKRPAPPPSQIPLPRSNGPRHLPLKSPARHLPPNPLTTFQLPAQRLLGLVNSHQVGVSNPCKWALTWGSTAINTHLLPLKSPARHLPPNPLTTFQLPAQRLLGLVNSHQVGVSNPCKWALTWGSTAINTHLLPLKSPARHLPPNPLTTFQLPAQRLLGLVNSHQVGVSNPLQVGPYLGQHCNKHTPNSNRPRTKLIDWYIKYEPQLTHQNSSDALFGIARYSYVPRIKQN